MAQFWGRKQIGKIVPLDPEDKTFRRLKLEEDYLFKTIKVRCPKLHRKFFALLNLVFENQDEIEDEKEFRSIFQIHMGYYKMVDFDGHEFPLPLSIAYENMDQLEFEEFYKKAYEEAKRFLRVADKEIQDALRNFK